MKKLDEARTTREELLGMLTEARKQLEIKVTRLGYFFIFLMKKCFFSAATAQSSQPASSRCPSATSTTPSTAPCHSPGFFVPTACATVPFHNNSAESRSACDSLRNTKSRNFALFGHRKRKTLTLQLFSLRTLSSRRRQFAWIMSCRR